MSAYASPKASRGTTRVTTLSLSHCTARTRNTEHYTALGVGAAKNAHGTLKQTGLSFVLVSNSLRHVGYVAVSCRYPDVHRRVKDTLGRSRFLY